MASANIEYRDETKFEMQEGSLQPGDCILAVDDILATGGTMRAAQKLVEQMGATISAFAFITHIPECKSRLPEDIPVIEAQEQTDPEYVVQTLTWEAEDEEVNQVDVVLVHPDMVSWVERIKVVNRASRIYVVSFDHFADGYPNFNFPEELIKRKRVIYIGTMFDYKGVMDQLNQLIVWSRYAKTLKILFPWYGPATMEKTPMNQIATAETMARLICDSQRSNTTLTLIDPHVLSIRLFSTTKPCPMNPCP